MDSTRQNKIARLIQKDLSEILLDESRTNFTHTLISITQVRISPDLSIAKVYVSIFTTIMTKEEILNIIKQKAKEIRGKLGYRVQKQLRIVPNLVFFLDDSLDYAEKIENLLKK
jgi:ribosome-binding factor A